MIYYDPPLHSLIAFFIRINFTFPYPLSFLCIISNFSLHTVGSLASVPGIRETFLHHISGF